METNRKPRSATSISAWWPLLTTWKGSKYLRIMRFCLLNKSHLPRGTQVFTSQAEQALTRRQGPQPWRDQERPADKTKMRLLKSSRFTNWKSITWNPLSSSGKSESEKKRRLKRLAGPRFCQPTGCEIGKQLAQPWVSVGKEAPYRALSAAIFSEIMTCPVQTGLKNHKAILTSKAKSPLDVTTSSRQKWTTKTLSVTSSFKTGLTHEKET